MKNIMKKFISALFVLALFIGPANASEDAIKEIRTNYKNIRDALSTMKQKTVELTDLSTEGGVAISHFENDGSVRMIRAELYYETGKEFYEFYFMNQELFFVFYQAHKYNVPHFVTKELAEDIGGEYFEPEKTTISEDRYYFKSNKMIRWLDNARKTISRDSKNYSETESRVLDVSKQLKEKLK